MRNLIFYPHGKDRASLVTEDESSIQDMLEAIFKSYPPKSKRNPAPSAAQCYINGKILQVTRENREELLKLIPLSEAEVVFVQDCTTDQCHWKSFLIISESAELQETDTAEA